MEIEEGLQKAKKFSNPSTSSQSFGPPMGMPGEGRIRGETMNQSVIK